MWNEGLRRRRPASQRQQLQFPRKQERERAAEDVAAAAAAADVASPGCPRSTTHAPGGREGGSETLLSVPCCACATTRQDELHPLTLSLSLSLE